MRQAGREEDGRGGRWKDLAGTFWLKSRLFRGLFLCVWNWTFFTPRRRRRWGRGGRGRGCSPLNRISKFSVLSRRVIDVWDLLPSRLVLNLMNADEIASSRRFIFLSAAIWPSNNFSFFCKMYLLIKSRHFYRDSELTDLHIHRKLLVADPLPPYWAWKFLQCFWSL